jgi:hypothetical protein
MGGPTCDDNNWKVCVWGGGGRWNGVLRKNGSAEEGNVGADKILISCTKVSSKYIK